MAVPSMSNNTPQAGHISWGAFNIQLNGVVYSVDAGSTSQSWVWWKYNGGSPSIVAGPEVPSDLQDDDLVLFANKNGVGVRIQSTSFLDGELLVDGSIFAEALSTNLISSQHIVAAGLDAGVIKFGTMHGDRIEAGTITVGQVDGLSSELANKGKVWTQEEAPVPSATYEWTGTPHYSQSIKKVGGVEVDRNYVLNPSAETGSSAMGTSSGGQISEQSSDHAWIGRFSIKHTRTTESGTIQLRPQLGSSTQVPGGQRVYAKIRVKCDTWAGVTGPTSYRDDAAGVSFGYDSSPTVEGPDSNGWYTLSSEYDIPEEHSLGSVYWRLGGQSFTVDDVAYFDGAQVSTSPITEYFDGDTSEFGNDLWIDTANGNLPHRWENNEWVAVQDEAIQDAYSRWAPVGHTTIHGDMITTNTIVGNRIMGQTIGVEKLVVGDLANMAEINESREIGNLYDSVHKISTSGWSRRDSNSSNYFMFRNQHGPLPFKTGDRLRVAFEAFSSTARTATLGLWTYDPAAHSQVIASVPLTTTSQSFDFEFDVTIDTALKTAFLIGLSNVAGVNVYLRNVRAYRMNAGELIVDGSITANKLQAASITGDKIAADTIVASNLAISDLTNYYHDGTFRHLGKSWDLPTNALALESTSEPNSLLVATAATGDAVVLNKNRFDVAQGDQFYVEGEILASSANAPNYNPNVGLRMFVYNDSGANVAYQAPSLTAASLTAAQLAAAPNTWIPVSATLTVPEGVNARSARFGVVVTGGAGNGKVYRFRNLKALRKSGGKLIVDGSIASTHVVTEGLDAGVIKFGTMNGDRIGVNTLVGDRIIANTIGSSKLMVGSLDNLLDDPTFLRPLGEAWGQNPGISIDPTGGRGGQPALKIVNSSAQNSSYNTASIACESGEWYHFSVLYHQTGASVPVGGFRIGAKFTQANGSIYWPSVGNTTVTPAGTAEAPSRISGKVKAPEGATTLSVYVASQGTNSSGILYVDYASVTRAMDGELIVDGAITADKIAAQTITSTHIGANSIKAENLDIGETTNILPPLSNWSTAMSKSYAVDSVGPYLVLLNTTSSNQHAFMSATQSHTDIPVVPGEEYVFSWDVYANYSGYTGSARPYFTFYNGNYTQSTNITGPETPQGTTGYPRKEITFTVPANRSILRVQPYLTPNARVAIRNPQLRRAAGLLTVSSGSGGVRISNYTNPANGNVYQGVVDFLVDDSDSATWTNGRMFSQMFNNSWNSNKRTGAIRITAPYVSSQGVASAPYIDIRRADNQGELFVSAEQANFLANSFLFSSQDASVVDFTLQYATKNVFSFRGKGGGPKIDMKFGDTVYGFPGNVIMANAGSTGAQYDPTWLSVQAKRVYLNATEYSGAGLYAGSNQGDGGIAYFGTSNVGLRYAANGVLHVEGALGNSLQLKAFNVALVSDRSTKESPRALKAEGVLERVRRTKVYDWAPKGTNEFRRLGLISEEQAQQRFRGIIADEAEETLPEVVVPPAEDDSKYGISLYAYMSTLHLALSELADKVDELQSRFNQGRKV